MDVDVHLFETLNTSDCVARDDESLTYPVDCGTYYVVVDTYHSGSTGERPGPYDLMISLTPSGGSCGSGPPTFDFEGDIGDPCAYEGNPNLPYCNNTLGAEICIYTTGTNPFSFCSLSCETHGDCDALPGGGCCEDLGENEYYCIVQSLCDTTPGDPDAGVVVGPDASIPGGPDAGPGDPGPDGSGDAGVGGDGDGGGCQAQPRGGSTGTLLLVLGALGLAVRRRR
jgi:MYXO-CTERM domain-containing protein